VTEVIFKCERGDTKGNRRKIKKSKSRNEGTEAPKGSVPRLLRSGCIEQRRSHGGTKESKPGVPAAGRTAATHVRRGICRRQPALYAKRQGVWSGSQRPITTRQMGFETRRSPRGSRDGAARRLRRLVMWRPGSCPPRTLKPIRYSPSVCSVESGLHAYGQAGRPTPHVRPNVLMLMRFAATSLWKR
jgi:hypothetical protein